MSKATKRSAPKRKITFLCLQATSAEVGALAKKFPSANFIVGYQEETTGQVINLEEATVDDLYEVVIVCATAELPKPEECRALHSLRKSMAHHQIVSLENLDTAFLIDRATTESIITQLKLASEQANEWQAIIKQLHFEAARLQSKKSSQSVNPVIDPKPTFSRLARRWQATFINGWSALIKESPVQSLSVVPVQRLVFSMASLIMLIAMVWMAGSAGISGDEFRYIRQSENVINYFESGGEDVAALSRSGIDPQHYNAQSFDVVVTKLSEWLDVDDQFVLRHRLNALVGWIGILFIGLLIGRSYGWWWGLLTMVLVFFSPRYLGHCFNNHRDIPVATAYTVGLYFYMRYFREFRRVRWTTLLGILLAISFAFSTRLASGILMIGILGVITLVRLALDMRSQWLHQPIIGRITKHVVYLLPTVLIAYGLGILLWPFGLEGPIKNSLEVFNASSNLGVSLRQTFEGNFIMSNEIPKHYIPKYFLITTPVFVLFSLLATGYAILSRRIEKPFLLFVLCFAFVFPLLYAVMAVKNDYGGWRHFLFFYPCVAAIGTIGLYHLYQLIPGKFRVAIVPLLALAMVHPVRHTIANHPYQYIYYNEAIGGVKNAMGEYETDYSLNSLQEGVRWVVENAEPRSDGKKIMVASNDGGQLLWGIRKDTARFAGRYKRFYEKFDADWDYGVFVNMYVHPEQIKAGNWPPPHTVHEIKVDGVTICAVLKRENKDDLAGFEAAKSGDHQNAVNQFRKYLQSTPNNAQVWGALANSLRILGRNGEAMEAIENGLIHHPASLMTLNSKGLILLSEKKYAEAEPVFRKLQAEQRRNYAFSYYLALCLANQQKYNDAKEFIDLSLGLNQKFAPAYDLGSSIYRGLGLTAQAERLQEMKAKIK